MSWFKLLGDANKFIKQNDSGQIETEVKGAVEQHLNTLNDKTIRQLPKVPNPSRISSTLTRVTDGSFPKWMDKNGKLYGNKGAEIQTSTDGWNTKSTIHTHTINYYRIEAVLVTETGRVVYCHRRSDGVGEVYVSDDNQTNFTLAFAFTTGYTSYQYGHGVYGDIVIMCAYGTDGNEVYMSEDSGATWSKIYAGTKTTTGDTYHIHDCVYDSYAGRLWLAVGDNGNANSFYSDDFGTSWIKVSNTNGNYYQYTQIIPYSHGVVFATDGSPDGYRYWKRPLGQFRSPVNSSDIVNLTLMDGTAGMKWVATKYSKVNIDGGSISIVPWMRSNSEGVGGGLIHASVDGLNWFEIWRMKPTNGAYEGVYNVIGPSPNDPSRTIFARVHKKDGASTELYLLKASLPKFN